MQEHKFPASLSFTLIEPSSRLMWKSSYEPATEIVSPSAFSVVDQGSFETFMTIVFDSVVRESIVAESKCPVFKASGSWHQISRNDSILYSNTINEQLHISVTKDMGKLRVRLKNPQNAFDDENKSLSQNLFSE